jgi:hypothetical protein
VRWSTLWGPVERWGEYRRRQRAALDESNRIGPDVLLPTDHAAAPGPEADSGGRPATEPLPAAPPGAFGDVGQPLNRHSPFYLGFFGATGALLAWALWTPRLVLQTD